MTEIPTPGQPVRGSRSGAPIMALFDLLGRRWAMGVLWTVCENEPATFRALQAQCESISPAVLNKRIKELREARLMERDVRGYVASPLGRELYAMLVPMGRWSKDWAAQLAGQDQTPD